MLAQALHRKLLKLASAPPNAATSMRLRSVLEP
jgi:hypothetical protein